MSFSSKATGSICAWAGVGPERSVIAIRPRATSTWRSHRRGAVSSSFGAGAVSGDTVREGREIEFAPAVDVQVKLRSVQGDFRHCPRPAQHAAGLEVQEQAIEGEHRTIVLLREAESAQLGGQQEWIDADFRDLSLRLEPLVGKARDFAAHQVRHEIETSERVRREGECPDQHGHRE
jgi:hypothetical protein